MFICFWIVFRYVLLIPWYKGPKKLNHINCRSISNLIFIRGVIKQYGDWILIPATGDAISIWINTVDSLIPEEWGCVNSVPRVLLSELPKSANEVLEMLQAVYGYNVVTLEINRLNSNNGREFLRSQNQTNIAKPSNRRLTTQELTKEVNAHPIWVRANHFLGKKILQTAFIQPAY